MKSKSTGALVLLLLLSSPMLVGSATAKSTHKSSSPAPVLFWSTEARRAIVPPAAGPENFGNKFPGEAAVYMGIVHIAIYDTAVALDGGYQPFLIAVKARPQTSEAAAIATAAYDTLIGLQPQLGLNADQQAILDSDYASYMAGIPETKKKDAKAKADGTALGEQVAAAVVAARTNDGRELNPTVADLNPPSPGPGVWQPNPTGTVLGLRLPGMKPLAIASASQFRPGSPNVPTSQAYADNLNQVEALGSATSTDRTDAQTTQALFWTDHDIRMFNDAMLQLAIAHNLDLVETARMLAMAHVAGGDAMIGCFDAKFYYWNWRPFQAIPGADTDGNPNTTADPNWQPLRATPDFPEYPAAHACHTSAVATALTAFFGTDNVSITLDSRVTGTTHQFTSLQDIVTDVNWARVLAGFHYLSSSETGSTLGNQVGQYVVTHDFQPTKHK
ncbi:MAG: vanadium-dependent haloperoxidase [Nitrolancea sp.]